MSKGTIGDPRKIQEDWPRKHEVAGRIHKSLAAVTRFTALGKLTRYIDEEGNNRYDPTEVEVLATDPATYKYTAEDRKEEFAEYQLVVVKDLIGLVREPREKIDAIQFQIIAELRAEVVTLRAKINEMYDAVEKARDNSAERDVALEMVKRDSNVKQIAAGRLLDTVGKLITGSTKSGVQLTPDQLEELLSVNDDGEKPFLTPEQVNEAKKIVATKKNGSSVVEKAVKTVVESVKHDAG